MPGSKVNPRAKFSKTMQKRTGSQREYDLLETASLYLRGRTQVEIAEHISANRPYTISRGQVAYDLKAIHARWQQAYLSDYSKMKAREMARIDELERAYWDEWERSRQEKISGEQTDVVDEMQAGGQMKPSYSRKKKVVKKEQRDGDKHYLAGVQWCIDQRCKILGLLAPVTSNVNLNWREEAKKAGFDPDQVMDDLTKEFIEAAQKPKND